MTSSSIADKSEGIGISSSPTTLHEIFYIFQQPDCLTPYWHGGSSTHPPQYNELAGVFMDNGVGEIVYIAVSDAFVIDGWKKQQEAEKVTLIPDGNGDFSAGMGTLVDKSRIAFGKRSWRYSMLVKDGVIEKMFIEPDVAGNPFEVSNADTMLAYISPAAHKPRTISMMAKPDCPCCAKAKALLAEKGMDFEEIVLGRDATIRSVRAITGKETVPQVFVDGDHIGGSDELKAYVQGGVEALA